MKRDNIDTSIKKNVSQWFFSIRFIYTSEEKSEICVTVEFPLLWASISKNKINSFNTTFCL